MNQSPPVVIKKKRHSFLFRWRIERVIDRIVRKETSHAAEFEAFRRTVQGSLPSRSGPPILHAACNELYYWEFARTFLRSIESIGAPERFHLHLCEPSSDALRDVEVLAASLPSIDLTWTWDQGENATLPVYPTIYYAAVRFLIAPIIIEASNSTVLCLDIDGIARRSITAGFEELAGSEDVRLIKRPGQKSVRRVLASALSIRPTKAGRRFADRLGRSIATILKMRPRYHIDQIAIVRIVEAMEAKGELETAQMPLSFADHEFDDDSIIWTAKSWQRKNSEAFINAKGAVNGAFAEK
ncbi:hypothetical protein [Jiella mangrovi]|uniref:Uncharacterized protein n=1 Tax=Jiella mangrovi TaxID=2821407 RepID=A0ABS4BDZ1_9HYPH|nr:hypothetical protein [Jiella mangrovi]MBP0614964.1 hypothetical protein [Jiella mangrovi]